MDYAFPQLEGWREEFPRVAEWDRRINERASVKKAKSDRAIAMANK